jgi:hypothetical protein
MKDLYVEIMHGCNLSDMSLKLRIVIMFLNVFLHEIFYHILQ